MREFTMRLKRFLAAAMLLAAMSALLPAAAALGQATQPTPLTRAARDATQPAGDIAGPASPATSASTSAPSTASAPAGGGSRASRRSSGSRPARPETIPKVSSIEDCDRLLNKGEYAAAASGYRQFGKQEAMRLPAGIGLARALSAKGDYADALKALEAAANVAAAADANAAAAWQLEIAGVLMTLGQYEQALGHADRALTLRGDWAPAIFARGQALETLGRKDQAVETYRLMEKTVAKNDYRRDAPSLVALGRILDRYTVLTAQKASAQADNIFNNYLRQAYLSVDASYLPAYLAAGQFALSKHRPESAKAELELAAKINPRSPDVLVALGIASHDYDKAQDQADKALQVNPNSADALLLKAVCMMSWRKDDEAVPLARKVLDVNPNHLEALGLLAAIHTRMRDQAAADEFTARAMKINPRYAELHVMIGDWLADRRQYEQAQQHYRKAMEMSPELAEPVIGLGLVFMQTGDEDKALEILRKAHELDDYRQDVVNYLNILERLAKFEVKESEHFILKVDPSHDAVLLNQVSEYLESIYPQVCSDCGFEAPYKVIVEIFPTQTEFALRLTGRGWIPTVGACTGRVIVLAAPSPEKERTPYGTHNWAVVLRHELTHAITLGATGNRIPHWLTEAWAVWQQPDKAGYDPIRRLVTATREGKLFTTANIDWGFIRPKNADERPLAYAQSEWMLEFLISEKGYDILPAMLKSFADGKPQSEVFEKIVGIAEKDFDERFRDWARRQVVAWKFSPEASPKLADTAKLYAERPKDPNVLALHAKASYAANHAEAALDLANKALATEPNHRMALTVKAMSLVELKKYDLAIAAAEQLEQVDHDSAVAPRVAAQAYLAKGNEAQTVAKAIAALELLQQRQPLDDYSYRQLALVYTRLAMNERALPNLLHLHRHSFNQPKYARQIAEIYHSLKQDDQALAYYQQTLHMDPYDASVYDALAAIYLRAKAYPKAIEAMQNAVLLAKDSSKAWAKLAAVRFRAAHAAGDKLLLEQARQDANQSMNLEPNDDARQVIQRIEDEGK